jgi:hypothetical protein
MYLFFYQVSQWSHQQSYLSQVDSVNPIPRPTSKEELISLTLLYESLNGNFWNNNNNWLIDDPCIVNCCYNIEQLVWSVLQ